MKKRFTRINCKSGDESHHEAKTKAWVEYELHEEFLVQIDVYQGSVLLPMLFASALDVLTENAKEGLMIEI